MGRFAFKYFNVEWTIFPGGVLLIFYIYIGLADFFGVKILKFSIFLGFQKNHYFLG